MDELREFLEALEAVARRIDADPREADRILVAAGVNVSGDGLAPQHGGPGAFSSPAVDAMSMSDPGVYRHSRPTILDP